MPDSRLGGRLADLRGRGRAALIPYITAGHPDAAASVEFLRGSAAAGCDVVELGVPWSDPVADGPVIQASTDAALRGGVTLQGVLELLTAVAGVAPPVVLFSYLNPLLAYGPWRFAAAAREAGAAGILVTDLPLGADPALERQLRSAGLPLVRLVAPTTPEPRLRRIAAASEGFVYLVARLGVTGASRSVPADLAERVAAVRSVTNLPVAVGFGISSPDQAAAVARLADGVVVGSALVERMGRAGAGGALSWLRALRGAMDEAEPPAPALRRSDGATNLSA